MKRVKGGLYLSTFTMTNGRYGNEFIATDNITRQIIYYSVSYQINLDNNEQTLQAIHNYNMLGTPKTRYMNFNSLANISKGEIPVITVIYDYSKRVVSFSVNVLNKHTGIQRRVDTYMENAILGSSHRYEALNQMYKDIRRYAR